MNKVVNINGKFISNYIVCPTLCRACTHFLTEKTTLGDYVCTAHLNNYSFNKANSAFSLEHSNNSSYVSKERNECLCFEDKYDAKIKLMEERQREQEKEDRRLRDEAENQRKKDDEGERERQQEAEREASWGREQAEKEADWESEWKAERERKKQQWKVERELKRKEREEYEKIHCAYCGEKGVLIQYHHSKDICIYLHEKCFNQYQEMNNIFKKANNIFHKYENFFYGQTRISDFIAMFTGTEKSTKNYYDAIINLDLDGFSFFLEDKYKAEKSKRETDMKIVEERERKVKEEAERVKEQKRKEKEEAEREKREAEEQARILAEREAEQRRVTNAYNEG